MDTKKEVLVKAKAKIATMDTWCQGVLAKRPGDPDRRYEGEGTFVEVLPHDQRACQWCLDGAIHAALGGNALVAGLGEWAALYEVINQQLGDCALKLFNTRQFVSVNDGDEGISDVVFDNSTHEEMKKVAFDNAHKILDCAIASA
jgi:hypothetical protein